MELIILLMIAIAWAWPSNKCHKSPDQVIEFRANKFILVDKDNRWH